MRDRERAAAPDLHRAIPVFPAADLGRAVAYYRDVLGFTVAWQWGDPPERAGVVRDGVEIQLFADPGMRPAGPGRVYVHMAGVEAFFCATRERGAVFMRELGERPWGVRDFQVVDPDGNQLGFAEVIS
jgi:catechol 2,3-dioxygenase-like lactoylglutathione lyase family enzyme